MSINIYRVDFELLQRKTLPKSKRKKFKSNIYIILSESNTCALDTSMELSTKYLAKSALSFMKWKHFKCGLIDFINLCREVCQALILQINILLCVLKNYSHF